jgi:hypothetical protein
MVPLSSSSLSKSSTIRWMARRSGPGAVLRIKAGLAKSSTALSSTSNATPRSARRLDHRIQHQPCDGEDIALLQRKEHDDLVPPFKNSGRKICLSSPITLSFMDS